MSTNTQGAAMCDVYGDGATSRPRIDACEFHAQRDASQSHLTHCRPASVVLLCLGSLSVSPSLSLSVSRRGSGRAIGSLNPIDADSSSSSESEDGEEEEGSHWQREEEQQQQPHQTTDVYQHTPDVASSAATTFASTGSARRHGSPQPLSPANGTFNLTRPASASAQTNQINTNRLAPTNHEGVLDHSATTDDEGNLSHVSLSDVAFPASAAAVEPSPINPALDDSFVFDPLTAPHRTIAFTAQHLQSPEALHLLTAAFLNTAHIPASLRSIPIERVATTVILDENDIEGEPRDWLGTIISHHIPLIRLSVRHNRLNGLDGLQELGRTLTSIDLSHNAISHIDHVFRDAISLTDLDLSYNQLTSISGSGLAFTPRLVRLNLAGNNRLKLLEELHSHTELKSLDLRGDIQLETSETMQVIGSILTLKELFVDSNLTKLIFNDATPAGRRLRHAIPRPRTREPSPAAATATAQLIPKVRTREPSPAARSRTRTREPSPAAQVKRAPSPGLTLAIGNNPNSTLSAPSPTNGVITAAVPVPLASLPTQRSSTPISSRANSRPASPSPLVAVGSTSGGGGASTSNPKVLRPASPRIPLSSSSSNRNSPRQGASPARESTSPRQQPSSPSAKSSNSPIGKVDPIQVSLTRELISLNQQLIDTTNELTRSETKRLELAQRSQQSTPTLPVTPTHASSTASMSLDSPDHVILATAQNTLTASTNALEDMKSLLLDRAHRRKQSLNGSMGKAGIIGGGGGGGGMVGSSISAHEFLNSNDDGMSTLRPYTPSSSTAFHSLPGVTPIVTSMATSTPTTTATTPREPQPFSSLVDAIDQIVAKSANNSRPASRTAQSHPYQQQQQQLPLAMPMGRVVDSPRSERGRAAPDSPTAPLHANGSDYADDVGVGVGGMIHGFSSDPSSAFSDGHMKSSLQLLSESDDYVVQRSGVGSTLHSPQQPRSLHHATSSSSSSPSPFSHNLIAPIHNSHISQQQQHQQQHQPQRFVSRSLDHARNTPLTDVLGFTPHHNSNNTLPTTTTTTMTAPATAMAPRALFTQGLITPRRMMATQASAEEIEAKANSQAEAAHPIAHTFDDIEVDTSERLGRLDTPFSSSSSSSTPTVFHPVASGSSSSSSSFVPSSSPVSSSTLNDLRIENLLLHSKGSTLLKKYLDLRTDLGHHKSMILQLRRSTDVRHGFECLQHFIERRDSLKMLRYLKRWFQKIFERKIRSQNVFRNLLRCQTIRQEARMKLRLSQALLHWRSVVTLQRFHLLKSSWMNDWSRDLQVQGRRHGCVIIGKVVRDMFERQRKLRLASAISHWRLSIHHQSYDEDRLQLSKHFESEKQLLIGMVLQHQTNVSNLEQRLTQTSVTQQLELASAEARIKQSSASNELHVANLEEQLSQQRMASMKEVTQLQQQLKHLTETHETELLQLRTNLSEMEDSSRSQQDLIKSLDQQLSQTSNLKQQCDRRMMRHTCGIMTIIHMCQQASQKSLRRFLRNWKEGRTIQMTTTTVTTTNDTTTRTIMDDPTKKGHVTIEDEGDATEEGNHSGGVNSSLKSHTQKGVAPSPPPHPPHSSRLSETLPDSYQPMRMDELNDRHNHQQRYQQHHSYQNHSAMMTTGGGIDVDGGIDYHASLDRSYSPIDLDDSTRFSATSYLNTLTRANPIVSAVAAGGANGRPHPDAYPPAGVDVAYHPPPPAGVSSLDAELRAAQDARRALELETEMIAAKIASARSTASASRAPSRAQSIASANGMNPPPHGHTPAGPPSTHAHAAVRTPFYSSYPTSASAAFATHTHAHAPASGHRTPVDPNLFYSHQQRQQKRYQ